jgi:hypothetical protein
MGMGSEGYCSLEMDRMFIGFELKPEYFGLSVENLKVAANDEVEQLDLFSVVNRVEAAGVA